MTFGQLIQLLEQAATRSLSDRDKDILAALLIGEAGGEKDYIAGMAAVMNVIVNRANNDTSKFIRVALQPKQFSTFNNIKTSAQMDQRIQQTKKHTAYARARSIVDSAIKRTLPGIAGTSTHYYANKGEQQIKAPTWAKTGKPESQIGSHKFFTNVPYKQIK